MSLRRGFSWSFFGNAVYSACQWLTLVVVAKLGTPEMVGRFSLALALTAPIVLFSNLALNTVQVTDAKREHSFADYLGLRSLTARAALIAIAILAFAGRFSRSQAIVIAIVGLSKVIDAITEIFTGVLQQREKMDGYARTIAANGIVSIAAITIAMIVTRDVISAAAATAVGSAVALVFFGAPLALRVLASDAKENGLSKSTRELLATTRDWARLKRLATIAAPLGTAGMLYSLNTAMTRYFLERDQGERAVGIFSALSSVVLAGNTIVAALSQAASPRLAKHFAARDRAGFRSLLARLLAIASALGAAGFLGALLLGRVALSLVFKPEYAERQDVFLWLMAGAFLQYIMAFLGVGVTTMRIFRPQLPIHLVSSVIFGATSFVLIRHYGMMGAAWGVAVGSCPILISYSILLVRGLRDL